MIRPTRCTSRGTPKRAGGSCPIPGSEPSFSVVVATFNRGRHIRPTLESVLGQSFDDFELIVVADGCTDETVDVVRSFESPKLRVEHLRLNSGSQSAPNNLGIARANGAYVAYLGHDDVWHPDHLSDLARAFARSDRPEIVAAGCVFHGPPGSDITFVTGMLDADRTAGSHFLPPSALAHVRSLTERIGPWRDPRSVAAPVDSELMLRAVSAGARVVSTGAITAHKFAAGHRYLSYLRPASFEQAQMLSALRTRAHSTDWTGCYTNAAKAQGRYMTITHFDYDAAAPGTFFVRNNFNKGLGRPALQRLDGDIVLRQTDEPRALDWYGCEASSQPYRWSGPSRRPRLLIPFCGSCTVTLSLNVLPPTPPDIVDATSFHDEDGKLLTHATDTSRPGVTRLHVDVPLKVRDYTVLGVTTDRMFCAADRGLGDDTRSLGIALGNIEFRPHESAR